MSADRYSRQSFLGPDAEARIARCTVGIAGLGGGGSHIVQQLAHIGFKRYVMYDGDAIEESNLNRLVGARSVDVVAATPKLHLAKMMITGSSRARRLRGSRAGGRRNPSHSGNARLCLAAWIATRAARNSKWCAAAT